MLAISSRFSAKLPYNRGGLTLILPVISETGEAGTWRVDIERYMRVHLDFERKPNEFWRIAASPIMTTFRRIEKIGGSALDDEPSWRSTKPGFYNALLHAGLEMMRLSDMRFGEFDPPRPRPKLLILSPTS